MGRQFLIEQNNKSNGEPDMNLEVYYKNPIIDSWTYVSEGMDNLKDNDPESYNEIKRKQSSLSAEIKERIEDISQTCKSLGLDCLKVKSYVDEFLRKFPLALRNSVGWDDVNFIFLYIFTKLLKPKIIIETGCNVGFSSTFIALAVKENNNGCKFYTMDPYSEYFLWEKLSFVEHRNKGRLKINYERMKGKCEALSIVPEDLKQYIIFKYGHSEDVLPDLLEQCSEVDIFFHDSDHSYKNTVWECMSVLPYLRKNGYILVHDIELNLAFRETLGRKGGVVIRDCIGVFKKTGNEYVRREKWSTPSDNYRLNDEEYHLKKIKLDSSPPEIVVQLDGTHSLDCIFRSYSDDIYKASFDNFYQRLEGRICRYISQTQRIIFKSCRGIFHSHELEWMINKRLNCIEIAFPDIEKVYYTNGLDLNPYVCDFIVSPRGILSIKYTVKNSINIFLPASNRRLFKIQTGSDSFLKILKNIRNLIKLRRSNSDSRIHLTVNIIFLITTLNIKDLPGLVKLASNLGVDKVVCYYGYIDRPEQAYLSCFFKQELTNKLLAKAKELAKRINFNITLPPKFSQKKYPELGLCRRAWSGITIDAEGNILSCDSGTACKESLIDNNSMDAWNGVYYQSLRTALVENNCRCFQRCIQANPRAVNNFRSHIFTGA